MVVIYSVMKNNDAPVSLGSLSENEENQFVDVLKGETFPRMMPGNGAKCFLNIGGKIVTKRDAVTFETDNLKKTLKPKCWIIRRTEGNEGIIDGIYYEYKLEAMGKDEDGERFIVAFYSTHYEYLGDIIAVDVDEVWRKQFDESFCAGLNELAIDVDKNIYSFSKAVN